MEKIEHVDLMCEIDHCIDLSRLKRTKEMIKNDVHRLSDLRNSVMKDVAHHLQANFSFKTYGDNYYNWTQSSSEYRSAMSQIEQILL